jgi:DNA invertase Pin-like site-specific DNA recombinase
VYVEKNLDHVFDEYKILKYGYARLSTEGQNAALKRHGCKNIFTDDGLPRAMSIESRRACPELVERGRLYLAQDAVLGWNAPLKVP